MIEVLDAIGITGGWALVVLAAAAVFGAGRLARLITYDDFPPSVWLRMQWDQLTHDGPWAKLVHCYWCLTPWIMLVTLGLLVLAWQLPWLASTWLAFYGWMALSYVASMVVNRDERE